MYIFKDRNISFSFTMLAIGMLVEFRKSFRNCYYVSNFLLLFKIILCSCNQLKLSPRRSLISLRTSGIMLYPAHVPNILHPCCLGRRFITSLWILFLAVCLKGYFGTSKWIGRGVQHREISGLVFGLSCRVQVGMAALPAEEFLYLLAPLTLMFYVL